MALVSKDEVLALLGDEWDAARSVSPFIDTADLVVQEKLLGKGLTDARLKIVELWLAAHYAHLSLNRGTKTMERIGLTEERYSPSNVQGKNQGFSLTTFGQNAIILDTTGTLYNMGLPQAEFKVMHIHDDDTYSVDDPYGSYDPYGTYGTDP